MAIELEPWIQLVRGCCGVLVLVTAITPIPTLKIFGTGRSITNCNLNTLLFLFLALFFIYAAVFFRLVAEAVSRNSLPSIHAAFSETALVLATFMNAERLGDRDDKSPIHLNRAVSWCLLCAIELFVVVWTGLPGGQTSPPLASRVSAAIDVCKAATCVMILLQILPAIIANCNTASKPSPASPLDASSNPADILSLQMDTLREVEKLGGWWPLLKLFGVFFQIHVSRGRTSTPDTFRRFVPIDGDPRGYGVARTACLRLYFRRSCDRVSGANLVQKSITTSSRKYCTFSYLWAFEGRNQTAPGRVFRYRRPR